MITLILFLKPTLIVLDMKYSLGMCPLDILITLKNNTIIIDLLNAVFKIRYKFSMLPCYFTGTKLKSMS